MAKDEGSSVWVRSLVASRTKEPAVHLGIGDTKGIQMSAEQAREVALNILSAAEAAQFDAALYKGLRERDFSEEDVARILVMVRSVREKEQEHQEDGT